MGTLVLLMGALAYADRPPPAHTGGFGEPTCQHCHFDNALDDDAGTLALAGWPPRYAPGQTYPLVVKLTRPELQRGGFQLSVRYADGGREGRQAGRLVPGRAGTAVDLEQEVQYIRHTLAGSAPAGTDTLCWTFDWRAPPKGAAGAVVVHLAANAANGDDSEFGDFIYTLERTSPSP